MLNEPVTVDQYDNTSEKTSRMGPGMGFVKANTATLWTLLARRSDNMLETLSETSDGHPQQNVVTAPQIYFSPNRMTHASDGSGHMRLSHRVYSCSIPG